MNILIVADMEGITGIYEENISCIRSNSKDWEAYGRRMITQDVKVIVNECLDCGAESITICDAHDNGNSIIREEFKSTKINFISQIWELKLKETRYDYAILAGFHGMNNSGGIIAHTFRPDIKRMIMLDKEIGEVGLILGLLNENKIPTILVTGDYHGVKEALEICPKCIGCIVKSKVNNKLNMLTEDESEKLIKSCVREAINNRNNIPLVTFNYPLNITLELINNDYLEGLGNNQDCRYIIQSDKLLWKDINFTDFFNDFYKLIINFMNVYRENLIINKEFVMKMRKKYSHTNKEKYKSNKELGMLLSKNLFTLTNSDRKRIETLFENAE